MLSFEEWKAQGSPTGEKKKVGGLKGLLLDSLPMIGGVIGGVGGTAFGGVGGIAGASGGSGLGELLKQTLSGEKDIDFGKVGGEALLGAAPGALGMLTKGVKAARTGKIAADASDTMTPISKLTSYEGAPDLATVDKYKQMISSGQKVDPLKVMPDSTGKLGIEDGKHRFEAFKQLGFNEVPTTGVPTATKQGFIGKVKSGAANTSQEGFGLTVGQSKGAGRVMSPDDAARVQDFITTGSQKYGGIRPGKPINQAKDAQNVLNNATSSLDDALTKINRSTTPDELTSITQNISQRVANNPMITKGTTTADKLMAKVQAAPDLQTLEQIRREADNIAYTATGAKKTAAAAQAKEVRDAIDEFITPLSSEYKAIKGDYSLAKDALEYTSKANKAAKGFQIPFTNIQVGAQGISGAKNVAASKIAGTGQQSGAMSGFRPFIKPAIQQGGVRMAASALAPDTTVAPETDQLDQTGMEDLTLGTPEVSQSQKLTQAAMDVLATGDVKTAATLSDMAKQMASLEAASSGSTKPLSAEAAKSVSNAQAGLEAIDLLKQAQSENPDARGLSAISGTFDPFGLVSNTLGTGQYENARQQAVDIIARLRTGAAITKDEESRFLKMLPEAGDNEATAKQKLGILERQFQRVANRSASATSMDPSEAMAM